MDNIPQIARPSKSGFVDAAIEAYNNQHHLIVRPDDVWITILTQLNFYVNAHSEQLRHLLVTHEGKKEMELASGRRNILDLNEMAEEVDRLIQTNVFDPQLRDAILPDFSTTTANDRIASSVIMMAPPKAEFSYKMSLLCGLPIVTLLGDKMDWMKLLEKIDILPSCGKETTLWFNLLVPILNRFVTAFDQPASKENKKFWQMIAHKERGRSERRYLSGWITAFCFFSTNGKVLHKNLESSSIRRISTSFGVLILRYRKKSPRGIRASRKKGGPLMLVIDGVRYNRVDMQHIPPAYAEVDVMMEEDGMKCRGVMVAGLVGVQISGSKADGTEGTGGHGERHNTLEPVTGWWIFQNRAS
ncbi:hypothetical protein BV898_10473 [Hypsibius exemplaris]|uniref:Uncharacterized protein n=1 Tax=Hypsibius exemplaris TaxID=2072580 RepID=A0A1W0WJM8_HYPEX|nr:hypothetical protein BV898_10473 [Hypsibius exemplaris]